LNAPRTLATLALLAWPWITSCFDVIDPFDPMVGSAIADRCSGQDSDPDQDVSFSSQILPIFRKESGPVGCGCHQPNDPTRFPSPIGFEQTGLDLSSYSGVRAGGSNSLGTAVIPGSPCESILVQKISAGPPFGARMPFNGPPFLDDERRQLIADWVAEGARDN